ncbi:MAG: universal stress protein [Thermoleophilia bacterium]|nr:universal stress protein [Thermoleophilia bacterium]
MGTIVVGVDGSESAGVALEFAAEEAALRGAELRVVSVRELSKQARGFDKPVPEVYDNVQRIGEAIVEDAVGRAKELQPRLHCVGVVLYGRPQDVLLDEAKGALLLVVGRRGQGGMASLLMGSVSRHLVDHAPCPVVVVPPLDR